MQPYPGPIDSAAAYFQVLAWYARQGDVLRFAQHPNIPEVLVLHSAQLTGTAFVGVSPQACLRQLDEWVIFNHHCQIEEAL